MKREMKRAGSGTRTRTARGGRQGEACRPPAGGGGPRRWLFSVGAMVPLLAASFIGEYRVRMGAVVAAVTVALVVFGGWGRAGRRAGGAVGGEGFGWGVAGYGCNVWVDEVDWVQGALSN
ncbi:vacuolar iron transporter homolog 4 [Phtheirospermum japonicum]|uniref:Vacuolar iron transporter homolog 4 n=1 Tax=Phtheirospermum japonicum TaxID=374723 RepID=A0A830CKK5_9LAMI|nr:vacuolar iron transporter homolog 4 [Phtheirospermum japonicum]